MNEFITFKIKKKIKENEKITTLIMDNSINAEPGQFLMAWIPGADEKPFGVADNSPLTLSIANVGPFSSKICSLKEGDLFSFKGPLGKSFSLDKVKEILLVAGGYGVVPLYFLAKKASDKKIKCTIILGAKTKKDLIYINKFEKLGCQTIVCTDDGSCGEKGFVTNSAETLFKQKKFDKVYACGPSRMMIALGNLCEKHNLDYEFSLEAYMKCGIGICGSCTIGDKIVCKDGPVFTRKELKKLEEFWV